MNQNEKAPLTEVFFQSFTNLQNQLAKLTQHEKVPESLEAFAAYPALKDE